MKVDPATGVIRVVRVACAQDMGVVVNPEGARQQMEGCIMMGLGYTLAEEVRFRNGEVIEKNFGGYSMPKFSWMPKIQTLILDSPDLPAQGGGSYREEVLRIFRDISLDVVEHLVLEEQYRGVFPDSGLQKTFGIPGG